MSAVLVPLIITFWLLVGCFEFALYITFGPPWLTLDADYLLNQIASADPVVCPPPMMLFTPQGYFSRCGIGLTGNVYYCDLHGAGSHAKTLVPWWSMVYWALERKRKGIASREKSV